MDSLVPVVFVVRGLKYLNCLTNGDTFCSGDLLKVLRIDDSYNPGGSFGVSIGWCTCDTFKPLRYWFLSRSSQNFALFLSEEE